jgi:GT2 family glycosyltransferase
MKKFAIGIPTINRYDLLKENLENYIKDFDNDIFVVDNGNQNIDLVNEKLFVLKSEQNLGVAASWNWLCKTIFSKHEWALLLNDDIYCGYGTDVVNKVIEESKVGIVQSYHNFSVILINKDLYNKIGEFDEGFYPAYYEDSDYLYRLKLAGLLQEVSECLNPKIALRSMTYEKDPDLVNNAMRKNRLRYIDKWGGSPLLEKYTIPYDLKW